MASVTCLPPRVTPRIACPLKGQTQTTTETRELDHLLAVHFGWWDVLIERKKPV